MIKHWTIFEGTPGGVNREQARVTLGMNKTISLRFDRNLKVIG